MCFGHYFCMAISLLYPHSSSTMDVDDVELTYWWCRQILFPSLHKALLYSQMTRRGFWRSNMLVKKSCCRWGLPYYFHVLKKWTVSEKETSRCVKTMGWSMTLITTQKEHILNNNSHEFHTFWVVIMPKIPN